MKTVCLFAAISLALSVSAAAVQDSDCHNVGQGNNSNNRLGQGNRGSTVVLFLKVPVPRSNCSFFRAVPPTLEALRSPHQPQLKAFRVPPLRQLQLKALQPPPLRQLQTEAPRNNPPSVRFFSDLVV